jgi:hypothetical protein
MNNSNRPKAVINQLIKLSFAIVALLMIATPASTQRAPDDCSWQSESKLRKAVKLRTAADGKSYTDYNQGRPITVDEWFKLTCGLDALVPQQIPVDRPIEGAETIRVTLRGYLLGAKFERDEDHDIHVELGSFPDWNTDHIVLEMSPGAEYCAARQALWKLVRRDGCRRDQCILRKPVEVLVTGYLLIGNPQKGMTDYCRASVSRGMHKGTQESRVRGLWRLQPVLSVRKLSRFANPSH